MAAGKPVVLAIDGVVRQMIEKAGAGIPVPPGDPQALANAIILLADDPESARRMGMQGRLYAEIHFNRVDLAAKFLDIMLGLVS